MGLEVESHLRQAEADLAIARTSIGLAMGRASNGTLKRLKLIDGGIEHLLMAMRDTREMAANSCPVDPIEAQQRVIADGPHYAPPRSSAR